MKELFILIQFDSPIPCRGDVLIHDYTTKINNLTIKVIFPKLDIKINDGTAQIEHLDIKAPSNFEFISKIAWGSAKLFSNKRSTNVELIATKINYAILTCQYNEDNYENVINQLHDGINEWRAQLYERIQLLEKPILIDKNKDFYHRDSIATGVDFYKSDDHSRININSEATLKGYLSNIKSFISYDEMQKILNEIDTSKQLKLEYQLYLKSLIERNSENYRYALMEATTACELCATQEIQKRCNELGIDGRGLCNTYYRSLGDRFALLKQLGIAWATQDPNKEIVKPRNDLFHNRTITPTAGECHDVLKAVRKYLNASIPEMYE